MASVALKTFPTQITQNKFSSRKAFFFGNKTAKK
jgi:hypothetical protein